MLLVQSAMDIRPMTVYYGLAKESSASLDVHGNNGLLDLILKTKLISIYNNVTERAPMPDTEFVKGRNFDREAEVLKVLGHPVRLKIVAGLMSQSCNVKKIWECLGLPQATVSQHLALLKNKGIIDGRRDGVEVYYQVISAQAREVVTALLGNPVCR